MSYLTDRKRAVGMGSAKTGTAHFWAMKVSAVALLLLIPLFVFTFGPMLGGAARRGGRVLCQTVPGYCCSINHCGWVHALQKRCASTDRRLCAWHGATSADHSYDLPELRRRSDRCFCHCAYRALRLLKD